MKKIYFDHAATTPVDKKVFEAMEPYFSKKYGNPSSIHTFGQETKAVIEDAREKVAEFLNCNPEEIIFTSGGTESDNLAIRGVAFGIQKRLRAKGLELRRIDNKAQSPRLRAQSLHIITSTIEHHAVLHTVEDLEKNFDFETTYLPVDQYGMVKPEDVRKAIKENTILVSVMYANNEVGTIQPISDITDVIAKSKEQRAKSKKQLPLIFHTDAVQATGYLDCDVKKLEVDLLSISAHKIYGPKGVGALYIKKGTPLLPIQTGGGHERKRRAGTENVPGIVGLGKAIELVTKNRVQESIKIKKLRDKLIKGVLEIPDVILTGHPKKRLPNSASFCVKFIEGESMLINLDMKGVACSTGSACTSGSLEPSHVLTAMGISPQTTQGSLRVTLGENNTEKEIDYFLKVLPEIVEKLREMSPIKED